MVLLFLFFGSILLHLAVWIYTSHIKLIEKCSFFLHFLHYTKICVKLLFLKLLIKFVNSTYHNQPSILFFQLDFLYVIISLHLKIPFNISGTVQLLMKILSFLYLQRSLLCLHFWKIFLLYIEFCGLLQLNTDLHTIWIHLLESDKDSN